MSNFEITMLALAGITFLCLGVACYYLAKAGRSNKQAEASHAHAAQQHADIMREYREDTRRALERMEGKHPH